MHCVYSVDSECRVVYIEGVQFLYIVKAIFKLI